MQIMTKAFHPLLLCFLGFILQLKSEWGICQPERGRIKSHSLFPYFGNKSGGSGESCSLSSQQLGKRRELPL